MGGGVQEEQVNDKEVVLLLTELRRMGSELEKSEILNPKKAEINI